MRKLLGAALSLVLVAGVVGTAKADILKNLKVNGEVEVSAVGTNNLTDFNKNADDKDGRATTRVLVNGMFDLSDEAMATISLGKNNRQYGAAAENLNTVESNVIVNQANVMLKNIWGWDHKLGRQYYGNPTDLVIYYGPSRQPGVRTLPVSALDAWTGWWHNDHMEANAIVGKLTDNTPLSGGNTLVGETDKDIRGVEVACHKMDAANMGVQLYNVYTHVAGIAPGTQTTVVAPKIWGKTMDGNFQYSAELTYNGGYNDGTTCNGTAAVVGTNQCGTKGESALLNGSYTTPFMGSLKLMAEFGWGSGNDPNSPSSDDKTATYVNSDYRPGDIYGGNVGGMLVISGNVLNPAGLGNRTIFDLGFMHTLDKQPKLSWGAQYYNFSLSKQPTATVSDKGLGSEIDLRTKWQQSENVAISAGYGWFIPGQAVKDFVANANTITQYYANFNVRF